MGRWEPWKAGALPHAALRSGCDVAESLGPDRRASPPPRCSLARGGASVAGSAQAVRRAEAHGRRWPPFPPRLALETRPPPRPRRRAVDTPRHALRWASRGPRAANVTSGDSCGLGRLSGKYPPGAGGGEARKSQPRRTLGRRGPLPHTQGPPRRRHALSHTLRVLRAS